MQQQRNQHNLQNGPTLRIITLGTFLILYQEHGQWEPVRDPVLAALGPSLAPLNVLVSSLPSMDSHRRAGRHLGQEWERHEASRDSVIDALWLNEEAVPSDPDNVLSLWLRVSSIGPYAVMQRGCKISQASKRAGEAGQSSSAITVTRFV